ncbi:hypothetical protein LINGRAHAP2_LOCUS1785 [Linum grandiflorum]
MDDRYEFVSSKINAIKIDFCTKKHWKRANRPRKCRRT